MYLAVILGSYSHPRQAHLRPSSRDLQMVLDTDSRGWRNPAKQPQLVSGHRNLPSAPSQARARQGSWYCTALLLSALYRQKNLKGSWRDLAFVSARCVLLLYVFGPRLFCASINVNEALYYDTSLHWCCL